MMYDRMIGARANSRDTVDDADACHVLHLHIYFPICDTYAHQARIHLKP